MNIQSYSDIEQAIEATATHYQNLFLDYVNNFISVEGFARYYGYGTEEAEKTISIGRKIHNQRVENLGRA